MTTLENLTNSPYDLPGGHRIEAFGKVSAEFDPEYLKLLSLGNVIKVYEDATEEDIRAVAEGLGVKVDKRWSAARIQKEIDKALESV